MWLLEKLSSRTESDNGQRMQLLEIRNSGVKGKVTGVRRGEEAQDNGWRSRY